ncbi:MAG TPA: lytic transglycosylase domain-containing protein [Vicinamibacterales bacterium]|nr:lytic transglycosylase domain-containing protein [Vicinamibacterales bacterium]
MIVLGSVSQLNAEMIFFANGRSMSVKDYLVSGDIITVTLRHGGEASFDKSVIARIAPDEVADVEPEMMAHATSVALNAPTVIDARPFAELIHTVSLKHGVDPALVHAVVQAESNYQPQAKSPVGARGLMQVMPTTGADFGIRNLYDPASNLEAGVQYLKFLLARFDMNRAIAAYNAGPGAVRKYRGIPPFPETQNYVKKVLANFQR